MDKLASLRKGFDCVHKFQQGEKAVSMLEFKNKMYVATEKGVYVLTDAGLHPIKIVNDLRAEDKKPSNIEEERDLLLSHLNGLRDNVHSGVRDAVANALNHLDHVRASRKKS